MCEEEDEACKECEAEHAYKIIELRDALEWLLHESDEYCRRRCIDAGYCFVLSTDACEHARKVLEPKILSEMKPFKKL